MQPCAYIASEWCPVVFENMASAAGAGIRKFSHVDEAFLTKPVFISTGFTSTSYECIAACVGFFGNKGNVMMVLVFFLWYTVGDELCGQ